MEASVVKTVDGWRGRWTYLVCAMGLLAALPQSAAAQEPDPSFQRQERIPLEREGPGSKWDITAFVGWKAPVANLTNNSDTFGTSVTPGVALGAEGAYWFRSGFGIGLQGFWAPSQLNGFETNVEGTIPETLGSVQYFAFSANAMYRLNVGGPAATVQPYFALGAGLRYLDVDTNAGPEVEGAADPALTAGMGVFVPLAQAMALRVEFRDYMSTYKSPVTGDSKLQNDLLISIGFTYRLF